MQAFLYLQKLVPAFGVLWNYVRFPSLRAGMRVEISGPGRFSYGRGARLGEMTRIELPVGGNVRLGNNVSVGRGVFMRPDPAGTISVGTNSRIQDGCRINGTVAVGKSCIFAPNIFISSGLHAFDVIPFLPIMIQTARRPEICRPVRISDDCFLGVNAFVAPGVTLGRGCVIGANSVVTSDLPPYSVAAGTPARVLRRRFAFEPKARIVAESDEDTPYFYDGFLADIQDGERITEGDFTLALARSNAREVHVCMSGTGDVSLGEDHQQMPVLPAVLKFDLGSNYQTKPFLAFKATAACRIRWAELR